MFHFPNFINMKKLNFLKTQKPNFHIHTQNTNNSQTLKIRILKRNKGTNFMSKRKVLGGTYMSINGFVDDSIGTFTEDLTLQIPICNFL